MDPVEPTRADRCLECGKAASGSNYAGRNVNVENPFPDRIAELTLPGDPSHQFLCGDCANKRAVVCKAHGQVNRKFGWGKAPRCEYCVLEEEGIPMGGEAGKLQTPGEVCFLVGAIGLTDRALYFGTQSRHGISTYTRTTRIPYSILKRIEVVEPDGVFDRMARWSGDKSVELHLEYEEDGAIQKRALTVDKQVAWLAATYAEELRKGRPLLEILTYLLQTPPPVLQWHQFAPTEQLRKYLLARKGSEHYRAVSKDYVDATFAEARVSTSDALPAFAPGVVPSKPPAPQTPPARRVLLPGIALAVLGAINLFFAAIMLAVTVFATETTVAPKDGGAEPQEKRQMRPMTDEELATHRLTGTCVTIVTSIPGLLLISGGVQMARRRSYRLAMLSSIVALVPGITVCCFAGVPVGIWSLMVLARPEVKQVFAEEKTGR